MINIQIHMNSSKNEYAICVEGDQVMRVETVSGIFYPLMEKYEIEAQSDIAFIDEKIQTALALSLEWVDNCCEDGAELECDTCSNPIPAGEIHSELVLYALGTEIGIAAAYHNGCTQEENK